MQKLKLLAVVCVIGLSFGMMRFAYRTDVERSVRISTCEASLASARADAADAGTQIETVRIYGKIEGYQDAQKDREEVAVTHKDTEKLAKPKCDPMSPPYFPCCGEDVQPGGITEESWPTPKEFKRRPALLTLSCARAKKGVGSAWTCGRTESACARSERRGGPCMTCYVHLASGRATGEDYAWTGHAIDEADGPWTADGRRGVFP